MLTFVGAGRVEVVHDVDAVAAREAVAPGPALEPVGAGPAAERVRAAGAAEPVVPAAADERVRLVERRRGCRRPRPRRAGRGARRPRGRRRRRRCRARRSGCSRSTGSSSSPPRRRSRTPTVAVVPRREGEEDERAGRRVAAELVVGARARVDEIAPLLGERPREGGRRQHERQGREEQGALQHERSFFLPGARQVVPALGIFSARTGVADDLGQRVGLRHLHGDDRAGRQLARGRARRAGRAAARCAPP